MSALLSELALQYHAQGKPGKIEVVPTKPLHTKADLSLAYTPGVAAPVLEIEKNPDLAYEYTAKGNLVAVVSNGTAILGLGNRGPLASKPVMEGKAVLFKRFAGIDVFDIELNAPDPQDVIRVCKALAPTFGGINLEDIKAPDCFVIEQTLKQTLDIPVFHDDQHGTAVITLAGLINSLMLVHKQPKDIKIVVSGAGAAALSCANLAVQLGVPRQNITLVDSAGVIYVGREKNMNPYKLWWAVHTPARTLADAVKEADVFYGLSAPDVLTADMVRTMARQPLIFAMANPDPEIKYDIAKAARPDAIVATGRSDYPNQINNVLGFPGIFRGTLDCRARQVNDAMKIAAARALAMLARQPVPRCVEMAYGSASLKFGPDYIVPTPFDPRVLLWVASAVAQAAMETGMARKPLDIAEYRHSLNARIPQDIRNMVGQTCVDCDACCQNSEPAMKS